MSRWSRRADGDPGEPDSEARGAESWNPQRAADPSQNTGGEEREETGSWAPDRPRRTPLERALSRRSPVAPAAPAPAPTSEPEEPPEPPRREPPRVERPARDEPTSTAWRPDAEARAGAEQREAPGQREAAEPQDAAEPREDVLRREAEQRRRVEELERRLQAAERALPPSLRAEPPALRDRAALWSGTVVRLLVAVAIFVVFVTAPLLMIYRSTCTVRGLDRDRWSFVPPGGDKPEGCREHRNGLQVLLGQD